MLASQADYDVYTTPRIGPVQFGDFVAADGSEREGLLQNAKYFRRTHRPRAWFARQAINDYLLSAKRNLGMLEVALSDAAKAGEDPKSSDEKQADASASEQCLRAFLTMANQLPFAGKDLIKIEEPQEPLQIGGAAIPMELACLIRSASNSADKFGGVFLNTQKGKGLGSHEATKQKRHKAGETVALLVLSRLIDQFSELGEPLPRDALHIYMRAKHHWCAPKHYAMRLKNVEAEGRAIASQWGSIPPPSDFDPDKARYLP